MSEFGIIEQIMLGAVDDMLDSVTSAVKARKEILNEGKLLSLVPGDIVVFNNTARPKYLQGIEARVIKVNRKTVVVTIPENNFLARKYRGIETYCPIELVDKVES